MKNKILITLAFTSFAIGLCQFLVIGILPQISKSLNIQVTLAALSVSVYALSNTFAAPVLATLLAKVNRKKLMIILLINVIIGNVICFVAPNLLVLLIGRVLCALSHAVFMTVGTLIATSTASKEKKSTALSIISGGFIISSIAGVPLGLVISSFMSWKFAFVIIIIASIICLIACIIVIPKNIVASDKIKFVDHLIVFKSPSIWLTYVAIALGYGAIFCLYTYMTPILMTFGHFDKQFIVLLLFVYGIFVASGNFLGGKLTNKNTFNRIIIFTLLQTTFLTLFIISKNNPILLILNLFLLGGSAFLCVPGLQHIVLHFGSKKAPHITPIITSYVTSSFNIGIGLGSTIGGIFIQYFSLQSLPIVSGILSVSSILILLLISKVSNPSHMKELKNN